MQFQTVFREKALARRAEREAIDTKLQVTAPHEWLLVLGLGVALVLLLVYGLIGQVEHSLSVETVLVRPGERVDVVAGVAGVVVDVLSEVGDTVTQGQPIARVRPPDDETGGDILRRLRERLATPDASPDSNFADLLRALAAPSLDTAPGRAANFSTRDIVAPHDGELVTLALTTGRRVAAGELAARVRRNSVDPVAAVGFVTREEALQLEPGMQAQVRLAVPGTGTAPMLPARVEHVSPRVVSPAPWLTEFGLDPPVRTHLLRATLTDPEPPPIVDGAAGTLRVVLGHRSFASLLFGGSGR